MMTAIEIVSIPVTDQQAAKAFYLKLGFGLMTEAPFQNGASWIQMGLPGSTVTITLVNWFPDMPAGSLRGFVIGSADIETEVEELKTKGIEAGAIDKTPWGKFATIKDPDGNHISLHGK